MASVPVAPPPWRLTGESYTFLLRTPRSKAPVPLPAGSYAPSEKDSVADQSAKFCGGLGTVMLVRYATSDVGPYDELLIVPGYFSEPPSVGTAPHEYLSISRIYVSTQASVENGRRNWNIPKHLASFSFEPISPGSTTLLVNVSDASTSKTVFCAKITPSRWLPSFPVHSTWLTALTGFKTELEQPPLPERPNGDVLRTGLSAKGWSRIAYIRAVDGWEGFGDGDGFPKFTVVGGMGTKLQVNEMIFKAATVVSRV